MDEYFNACVSKLFKMSNVEETVNWKIKIYTFIGYKDMNEGFLSFFFQWWFMPLFIGIIFVWIKVNYVIHIYMINKYTYYVVVDCDFLTERKKNDDKKNTTIYCNIYLYDN